MKKALLVFVIMLFAAAFRPAFAQYPIPSFHAEVKGKAVFKGNLSVQDKKRTINVRITKMGATDEGETSPFAMVTIATTDLRTVLGPYKLLYFDVLTVVIDDREWGVLIDSQEPVYADVWYSTIE
ncbi:MAG: hypothetical protein ACM3N9_06210 [Syntrophothermus sp.]